MSFPPPGDLPDAGIEPESLASLALAGGFFTTAPPGKPLPIFFILLRHESGENLPFISQWLSFHGKWSSNGLCRVLCTGNEVVYRVIICISGILSTS